MMLIVLYHIAGNIMPNNELSFAEIMAVDCLGRWGILGVDCFIIISTFFLQEVKNTNFKKIRTLLIRTYCYIFTFYIIKQIYNPDTGIQYIAKDIFLNLIKYPLFMNDYWFIWTYLVFLVIIPVLNRIRISTRIFSISVMLLLINCISAKTTNIGSDVFHFCCVYIASKYLLNNQYDRCCKLSKMVLVTLFLLVAGINILKDNDLLEVVPLVVIEIWEKLSIGRYGILPFFMALSLFCLFRQIPARSSKVVNVISSSMLGVYLFHENAYFRLSSKIPTYLMGNSSLTPVEVLFASFLIMFVIGIVVDKCYQFCYKRLAE